MKNTKTTSVTSIIILARPNKNNSFLGRGRAPLQSPPKQQEQCQQLQKAINVDFKGHTNFSAR